MITGRLDTLRAWFGRILVTAVIIAAGVLITSIATPSSAPTVSTAVSPGAGGPGTVIPVGGVGINRLGADTPTGAAVAALTGAQPDRALALIPPGFASQMGYAPVLDEGVPANPDGGCSSPIEMPRSFDAPCKTHDLGYDLLRYGAITGSPLGPWARQAIDGQLSHRMHAACTIDGCEAAAELADAGVATNSRRQDEGVPASETDTEIVTSTLKMLWQPVSYAAVALGSAPGRAGVAALIALVAIQLRRRSRPARPAALAAVSGALSASLRAPRRRRRTPLPTANTTV